MLTVDKLRAFGANTEEGLQRCINNEQFYTRLVIKAANDTTYDKLKEALDGKDYQTAFDLAHSLKGVLGNLAITPLFTPVSEITELLRTKTDTDYSGYIKTILQKRDELLALCAD